MNSLAKIALEQGLALNQRLAKTAANGADWLFKRDTLIQSGRTWFELVHDGDLMAVRYYGLPEEDGDRAGRWQLHAGGAQTACGAAGAGSAPGRHDRDL